MILSSCNVDTLKGLLYEIILGNSIGHRVDSLRLDTLALDF